MTGTAPKRREWDFTRLWSLGASAFALGFMLLMVTLFIWQSIPVWKHEGISYVTGKSWFFRQQEFGMLPMVYGSVMVAAVALIIAVPLGLGTAIFTSEFLPSRVRLVVKLIVELLSGIPSVVYGLLGILFLRNWVYDMLERFEPLNGDTLLTAGLLLAVMVLPTIMTLADDALRGVSVNQRLAARGLGLTQTETIFSIVLPQAAPGLMSAVLLGLGRALGETIAVFLVVGRQDNQWPDPIYSMRLLIESGQTLTSKLGSSETNIAYGDPLHWAAMVGLGLILLLMTAAITWVGIRLGKGKDGHA
ncbi:MAG TPA: phosphate ABC transporter permease subunit PstC [Verrucomicrobiae bacterium]